MCSHQWYFTSVHRRIHHNTTHIHVTTKEGDYNKRTLLGSLNAHEPILKPQHWVTHVNQRTAKLWLLTHHNSDVPTTTYPNTYSGIQTNFENSEPQRRIHSHAPALLSTHTTNITRRTHHTLSCSSILHTRTAGILHSHAYTFNSIYTNSTRSDHAHTHTR